MSNKPEIWSSNRLKALIDPMKLDSYYAKSTKTKRRQINFKSTEQKKIIRSESKKMKPDNNRKAMNKCNGRGDSNAIIIGSSIPSNSKKRKTDNNGKSMNKCSRSIREHKKMK
ncbi:hypothetical protein MKW92_026537, partial [Papaver armeniacum]